MNKQTLKLMQKEVPEALNDLFILSNNALVNNKLNISNDDFVFYDSLEILLMKIVYSIKEIKCMDNMVLKNNTKDMIVNNLISALGNIIPVQNNDIKVNAELLNRTSLTTIQNYFQLVNSELNREFWSNKK